MTFDRLVSLAMVNAKPEHREAAPHIVSRVLCELGFKVNEATGEIEGTEGFVMSLEKPYVPPEQKNIRFSGARRKR